jgi:hypothetical protein
MLGKKDSDKINYPDLIYRQRRARPLFIIHLLQIEDPNTRDSLYDDAVVAWSISFPKTGLTENRVEYVVTTTWLRENTRELDDDELLSDDA